MKLDLLSSFGKPLFGKTIRIAGFQHYLAGTVPGRDQVFVATNRIHPRHHDCILLVSQAGEGVWMDSQGNRRSGFFTLGQEHLDFLKAMGSDPLPLTPVSTVRDCFFFDEHHPLDRPVFTHTGGGKLTHGGEWSPAVTWRFEEVVEAPAGPVLLDWIDESVEPLDDEIAKRAYRTLVIDVSRPAVL